MNTVDKHTECDDTIMFIIKHDGTLNSYAEYFRNHNSGTLAFDDFPCIRKEDETCRE